MASENKPRIVYKLVRTDKPEDGTDVYVGSTAQPLKKRLGEHKHNTKRMNSKLYKRMRMVGIANWQILPLVVCPCNQKEIRAFEQQWVEMLKPDLNVNLPFNKDNKKNNERCRNYYYNSVKSQKYYCNVCDRTLGQKFDLERHFNSENTKTKVLNN